MSSVATSGRVRFGSALYISFVMSLLLFLSTLQLMVPAHFPLWNALLDKEAGWAGKIMKGWFFFSVVAPQTLCFCCTRQSQPAVTELSFFCHFPFLTLSASRVCVCVFYIVTLNIIQSSSYRSSTTLFPVMPSICEFSLDIFIRINWEWKLVSGDTWGWGSFSLRFISGMWS